MRTPPLCEVQGVYIWNESNETETRKLLGDEKIEASPQNCTAAHHVNVIMVAILFLPSVIFHGFHKSKLCLLPGLSMKLELHRAPVYEMTVCERLCQKRSAGLRLR
jgi:hypothetical protein